MISSIGKDETIDTSFAKWILVVEKEVRIKIDCSPPALNLSTGKL
jgi:hypothetical protein